MIARSSSKHLGVPQVGCTTPLDSVKSSQTGTEFWAIVHMKLSGVLRHHLLVSEFHLLERAAHGQKSGPRGTSDVGSAALARQVRESIRCNMGTCCPWPPVPEACSSMCIYVHVVSCGLWMSLGISGL